MIVLHRLDPDGLPVEGGNRVAFPVTEIQQIHEGRGGATIVTTPIGKLAVEEPMDAVVKMVEREAAENA